MEKFIVSARKYRPQNFSTVVGQSHITTTLKNAINNNQLAHAFLFCGPRGVGKTTCARILAKTINCENRLPDGEACNECPSCISFNEGGSMNIHELDAASNNSVDDIRALVEQVRFAPQAGKYKVYIIDEVHMLTSQAFNAFLKTLEEPPSYAIFILATTEKHKILPTILSRCQIFDFKRITTNDTVQHLEEICEKEEINTERPALQIIAQKSEGCMRDALSILDKIVSFTNGSLTYQNTLEHLNILDEDYYFKLSESLLNQDLSGSLLLYDDINKKGFEGDLVLNGFAEFLRNLLVSKDSKAASLLDVVENFKQKYTALAAAVSTSYLVSALNILNEAEINYRSARNKRLHVELTLIKLCYLQQALELSLSSGEAVKKKITENTRPLAFRHLSLTEMKEMPATGKKSSSETPAARLVIAMPDEGKLPPGSSQKTAGPETKTPTTQVSHPIPAHETIIHSGPEKTPAQEMSTTPPGETAAARKSSGKLGALTRIREQIAHDNGQPGQKVRKELTGEELQLCWNAFTEKLRSEKNPAEQSFRLAELRITGAGSFDIVTGNNLEHRFIEQSRVALVDHVQGWFNNKTLTYSIVVERKDIPASTVEAPLSSRQQYQKLADEYPLVKELRERLKLDLDY